MMRSVLLALLLLAGTPAAAGIEVEPVVLPCFRAEAGTEPPMADARASCLPPCGNPCDALLAVGSEGEGIGVEIPGGYGVCVRPDPQSWTVTAENERCIQHLPPCPLDEPRCPVGYVLCVLNGSCEAPKRYLECAGDVPCPSELVCGAPWCARPFSRLCVATSQRLCR